MVNVIKRNGSTVEFDRSKIKIAVEKAMADVHCEVEDLSSHIAYSIEEELNARGQEVTVDIEEIQDMVEDKLLQLQHSDVAKAYIKYRYSREIVRQAEKRNKSVMELLDLKNEELYDENSNKDVMLLSTMRDYMAGEVSKDLISKVMFDKDLIEAHNQGIIHIHDTDYIAERIINCGLVNLEDMLQNGTVISDTLIEKPKSFMTACTVATQVISQIASNQMGGQTITLTHLAPFVRVEKGRIIKQLTEELNGVECSQTKFNEIVNTRLKRAIKDGVQTINYQILTLQTTNGQAPFISIFMHLGETEEYKEELAMIIEEMLHQRILGVKNELGVYVTTAFPKLLYCLEEDNIHEDSPYYYLTELACECSAKRLVPDYISEKKMKELKEGNVVPPMGCRSLLSPYYDEDGKPRFYSRFNQGVCTLNLVDVALSSQKDMDKFWELMAERCKLIYRVLMKRHKRLLGTPVEIAPILWKYGAYARLKSGETIDKLLYNGYSTISMGYAGLYECVKYLTGLSHTTPEGKKLAIDIMKFMNTQCDQWKAETTIGFSLYGSPIESTTYKFAKCLRNRFGVIEGITDKDYVTNSYHVNVKEKIDAFSKLAFESELQGLSLGGAISYVETPNLTKNPKAVMEVVRFIYDNIAYAELNTQTSYCHVCHGKELLINEDMEWYCPNCGNKDFKKMNVAVRVCGYISTNPFNKGRTQDIKEREYHIGME